MFSLMVNRAENDVERAQAQVVELQPDVVLVEAEAEAEGGLIENLLASLGAARSSRVVRFTLHGNDLVIYQRQVRTITSAEDFVKAVTESVPC